MIFRYCSMSVSCVWLCPTHIVLCFLSCLSSSVSCEDTGRRQTRQITQHYMCWTQPYTRHRRRQTRLITLVYGCVQHIYCCVICLVCRRPVSCVWLCPTHIVLCYLSCLSSQTRQITQHYMCWTQPYTRHRTTTNKTNNTTLYVLDTTIHK
jgi:hypothetical protein